MGILIGILVYIIVAFLSLLISTRILKYYYRKSEGDDFYISLDWSSSVLRKRKHENVFDLGGLGIAVLLSIFWPLSFPIGGIYYISSSIVNFLCWVCEKIADIMKSSIKGDKIKKEKL